MDDSRCQDFFRQPTHPYQRRFEALRAVFVDGRSQKEVAEQFGVSHSSMRQWVYDLRRHCRHPGEESPFFKTQPSDAQPQPRRCLSPRRPRKNFPKSRIAASWSCPRRSPCAGEHVGRDCFCSCRCWLDWDLPSWCKGPTIPAPKRFPPTLLCSVCSP